MRRPYALMVDQWFKLLTGTQKPLPVCESADWRLFAREAARQNNVLARLGAILIVVVVLVMWPLDVLFMGRSAEEQALFTQWRLCLLGAMVGIYVVNRLPGLRRFPVLVTLPFGCFALGSIGWFIARLGGLELPFFYMLCFGLLIPAGGTVHLPARIMGESCMAAAMVAGFFGSVPAHAESPLLLEALFFVAMVLVACTLLGHIVYVSRCINFFQGLAIERQAQAVEELNRTLDARVRQKTADLARLTEHLQVAQDEERGRIARELHDELGQRLSAARFVLANTRQRFARSPTTIAPNLAELDAMLDGALASMRGIVSALRPPVLDQLGLSAAIEWLVRRTCAQAGLEHTLDLQASDALSPTVMVAAYRVLQESLANVMRHAGASRVDICLQCTSDRLSLEITDDGHGFPADGSREGNGLLGMRERAAALDGELQTDNLPAGGARVRLTLPLEEVPA